MYIDIYESFISSCAWKENDLFLFHIFFQTSHCLYICLLAFWSFVKTMMLRVVVLLGATIVIFYAATVARRAISDLKNRTHQSVYETVFSFNLASSSSSNPFTIVSSTSSTLYEPPPISVGTRLNSFKKFKTQPNANTTPPI
mmetsp:Transcript_50604/g.50977  ORF Transcript_50604/g.50977 Transcript_50604/m.50977 type:complete len:142 (-) Transcript_50604:668-1093(-)